MIKKIVWILSLCGIGLLGASCSLFASNANQTATEKDFAKVVKSYEAVECQDGQGVKCYKDIIAYRTPLLLNALKNSYDFNDWYVQVVSTDKAYIFSIPDSKITLIFKDTSHVIPLGSLSVGSKIYISGFFTPSSDEMNGGTVLNAATIYKPQFKVKVDSVKLQK